MFAQNDETKKTARTIHFPYKKKATTVCGLKTNHPPPPGAFVCMRTVWTPVDYFLLLLSARKDPQNIKQKTWNSGSPGCLPNPAAALSGLPPPPPCLSLLSIAIAKAHKSDLHVLSFFGHPAPTPHTHTHTHAPARLFFPLRLLKTKSQKHTRKEVVRASNAHHLACAHSLSSAKCPSGKAVTKPKTASSSPSVDRTVPTAP